MVLLHKLYLSVVHPPNVVVLLLQTLVSSNPVREAETAIVVYSVDSVREDLVKTREIHAKTVCCRGMLDIYRTSFNIC